MLTGLFYLKFSFLDGSSPFKVFFEGRWTASDPKGLSLQFLVKYRFSRGVIGISGEQDQAIASKPENKEG